MAGGAYRGVGPIGYWPERRCWLSVRVAGRCLERDQYALRQCGRSARSYFFPGNV